MLRNPSRGRGGEYAPCPEQAQAADYRCLAYRRPGTRRAWAQRPRLRHRRPRQAVKAMSAHQVRTKKQSLATYVEVNNERARVPAKCCRAETVLLALPPLAVVEAHLRRHAHVRGRAHNSEARVDGRAQLVVVSVPARFADCDTRRIPEAQRALGERTPSEELAGAREGTVVIVSEDDGYDSAVLQLGDYGGHGGLGGVVGRFTHEHDGARPGGVGEEGLEGARYLHTLVRT